MVIKKCKKKKKKSCFKIKYRSALCLLVPGRSKVNCTDFDDATIQKWYRKYENRVFVSLKNIYNFET